MKKCQNLGTKSAFTLFFFFWHGVFDHSKAYVAFLNVNLNFFINNLLAT